MRKLQSDFEGRRKQSLEANRGRELAERGEEKRKRENDQVGRGESREAPRNRRINRNMQPRGSLGTGSAWDPSLGDAPKPDTTTDAIVYLQIGA